MKSVQEQQIRFSNPASNNIVQQNIQSIPHRTLYSHQHNQPGRDSYQPQLNFEDDNTIQNSSEVNQSDPEIDFLRNAVKKVESSIRQTVIMHDHNIINKQNRPNNEEISKCMTQITKKYPKIHIQKIIFVLHELIHQGCKKGNQNSSQDSQKMAEMGFYTQFPDYTTQNRQRMSQNALPIDPNFSEQKRIAISFLNSGYGLRVLREQIKDPNISAPKYNNTITTIIKLAFRKVQDFLKQNGCSINPITTHQQKILRAPLINGDKWLPPQQLETFHKFIKDCFKMQCGPISIQSTYKLYDCCKMQLKQREANQMAIIRSKQSKLLKKPRVINQPVNYQGISPITQVYNPKPFYANPNIQHNGLYPRPGLPFPYRFNKPS